MHETIKKMAQTFAKQREQRRRACAVFTALAILVSLSTTYMLSRPANTQELAYACGLEAHEHSVEDGCYVLTCGYEEEESGGGIFGWIEGVLEKDPVVEEPETSFEQEEDQKDVFENGEDASGESEDVPPVEEPTEPEEGEGTEAPVVDQPVTEESVKDEEAEQPKQENTQNPPAVQEPVDENPVQNSPVEEKPVAEEPVKETPAQEETAQPASEPVVAAEPAAPVEQETPVVASEPAADTSDDVTEASASQTLVATMIHYDNAPEASESTSEPAAAPSEPAAAPSEPAAPAAPAAPSEPEADDSDVSNEPATDTEAPAEEPSESDDTSDEPTEDVVEEEPAQETEQEDASEESEEETEDEAEQGESVEDEIVEDAQENTSGGHGGKHVHTDACYELVCELPEHEHDESCIEEEELELICVIPEHTHGVECYAEAELICTDEDEAHEHGEGCYAEAALICDLEEHIHGDECYAVKQGSLLIILPEGAEVPEGYDVEYTYIDPDNRYGVAVYAQPGTFPEGAQLVAELMEEGSDAYEETSAVLEELVDRGEATYDEFVALDVHFLLDGEEVQPASPVYVCMNVVRLFSDKIDPNSISVRHFAENHDEVSEDAAEEIAEDPVEETVIEEPVSEESTEDPLEESVETDGEEAAAEPAEEPAEPSALDPVVVGDLLVETVADSSEATGQVEGITDDEDVVETVAAAFDMTGFSTVAFLANNDIEFTVQHYINIQRVKLETAKSSYTNAVIGEGNLPVIDTRGNLDPTDGSYGVLPSGTSPKLVNIPVNTSGADKGKVKTVISTEKVYKDETYVYSHKLSSNASQADNLKSINKLATNTNYTLSKVWVLKAGKSPTSTTESDWNVYEPSQVTFSNNAASGASVVITDGMVIRLVYNTNTKSHTNDVTFYDYNISNGYTSEKVDGKTVYTIVTDQKGINSSGNYSTTKAKLAFGNDNAGVGLGGQSFTRNGVAQTLNIYNNNGFKGCTFGIASSLDTNGRIVYNSDVAVPKLFNEEGTVTGKKNFSGSLNFSSVGDSFELVSVGGASIKDPSNDLNVFNNPKCDTTTYTHIWTNNFWPMDSASDYTPRDVQFGSYTDHANGTRKFSNTAGTTTGNLPKSDDGKKHNSYFGFNYAVNFELTPDYIGPLDYLFFGDDDMWVFLSEYDAKGNLKAGKLICDIGGVHSSVGEYVDLWDYIPKETRTQDTTYRLSFFYTERGASGSTCYMRFTLPSVSSVSADQINGVLEISKEVVGTTTDQEFTFDLDLGSSDEYTAVYSDGTTQKVKGNNNVITLAHGEKVTIPELPIGVRYTVTETAVDGYYTTTRVNSGTITYSNTASGTIRADSNKVYFVNTAGPVLPSTGGIGTDIYTTVGIVTMLGAGVLLLNQWRRKEVAFCRKKR